MQLARKHIGTALLAALVLTVPAQSADAQIRPTWVPLGTVSQLPSSGAVMRFYQRQRNRLIWFGAGPNSPAATQLLNILQTAPVDGMASGPGVARQVEQAVRLAQSGFPSAILEADRSLSAAWVQYVQALRRPPEGTEYGSDAVVPNTGVDLILSELASAPSVSAHLQRVSQVNAFYAPLRELAVEQYRRWGVVDPRMQLNLDRTRILPANGRFVLVNIASARLFMIENGQVRDSMRVIVGKAEKQTPMMASMIHYATFNPYWNVPDEMVRERIAQNVLKMGLPYLRDRGYEVVLNWSENAPVLSPDTIDWRAVAAGRAMVRVRQRPGPANSMGNLKFSFPNSEQIYLHDTPNKQLFDQDVRALSAGCVRLEDAERLAQWLLRREPRVPGSAPEAHVPLPQGVPIYLTYLTAEPSGGALTSLGEIFAPDTAQRTG